MKRILTTIAFMLVALTLAAFLTSCGPREIEISAPSTAQPTATPSPTDTVVLPITPAPLEEEKTVSIPAQAQDAVAWAQGDVARQLGTKSTSVVILGVEEVAWRDSSLGCPQPGMVYLQVITPGYRILLQGGDDIYEYHSASGADRAILCKQGGASERRPLPTRPPSDATQ